MDEAFGATMKPALILSSLGYKDWKFGITYKMYMDYVILYKMRGLTSSQSKIYGHVDKHRNPQ